MLACIHTEPCSNCNAMRCPPLLPLLLLLCCSPGSTCRFDEIMADIEGGVFGDKDYFKPLVDSISNMKVGNDWFLVANDFASYLEAQEEVDKVRGQLLERQLGQDTDG